MGSIRIRKGIREDLVEIEDRDKRVVVLRWKDIRRIAGSIKQFRQMTNTSELELKDRKEDEGRD